MLSYPSARRELARRMQGSGNRAKSRLQVARTHAKIRDDRHDAGWGAFISDLTLATRLDRDGNPRSLGRGGCQYRDDDFQRLEGARTWGIELGISPTAIALAYVLPQPFPTFPLIGPCSVGRCPHFDGCFVRAVLR